MSDEQFTVFATHEALGLTPEALAILREELRRRRTVPDPDSAIDVQLRALSSEEFERMLARFRQTPCPTCGGTAEPLNAATVSKPRFREVVVGCTPCLKQQLKDAMGTATPTSWLSVLFAPGPGLLAVANNDAEVAALEHGGPTQALRQYVWTNRGEWAHLLK